jgi:hypothetical protein
MQVNESELVCFAPGNYCHAESLRLLLDFDGEVDLLARLEFGAFDAFYQSEFVALAYLVVFASALWIRGNWAHIFFYVHVKLVLLVEYFCEAFLRLDKVAVQSAKHGQHLSDDLVCVGHLLGLLIDDESSARQKVKQRNH